MIIQDLWKITIGRDKFTELNNEHLVCLAKEMQEQHRDKNGKFFFNRNRYNCFIKYTDNELKKLAQMSVRSVREYMNQIYHETDPYEIEIQGWAMVQKWGEFVLPHHHVDHHLSAVFYVDVSEIESSPISNSGNILFNHPAPLSRSWRVNSNKRTETNIHTVSVKTNDFIIFPSYLIHSVNPWYGVRDRIAYAMNFFIKQKRNYEPMLSEENL